MSPRSATRSVLIPCVMSCVVALAACTPAPTDAPSATPTATPTVATKASASPTASATASPSATATTTTTPATSATTNTLVAPRNLKLAGRLPDISTPVPPGEGEAGRLTISWESATGPIGFRIYTKDCDGTVKAALDVPAADRQFGPIHACRPTGNLGVSALYAAGESAIAWVR